MLADTSKSDRAIKLREEILGLTREYFKCAFQERSFDPESDAILVSGRVFDERELTNLVDSALDFWLTAGRFALEFEKKFAQWFGVRECMLVNSGSSANLLAISALTSPELGDRRINPGDEVITAAAGFPTTVNPIVQNQAVPVF